MQPPALPPRVIIKQESNKYYYVDNESANLPSGLQGMQYYKFLSDITAMYTSYCSLLLSSMNWNSSIFHNSEFRSSRKVFIES